MLIVGFKNLLHRSALASGVCMALAGISTAQVMTTSFQNGSNGYTGTFDRRVSDRAADEVDGASLASYYLDGFTTDASSPDAQVLLRFDNLIGNEPGQIPMGATVLNATLTLTTSLASNAHTGGPYGVAGLLQPFNSMTSYFVDFSSATDLVSRGPWWQDGSATRAVGGFGNQLKGQLDSATVTSVVQTWVDGSLGNYGFAVQAGLSDSKDVAANTSDGWAIRSTGYPISDSRPRLDVSYTTASVQINSFQQGQHGYVGATMAIVDSGTNALIEDVLDEYSPENTVDAATLDQTFLDGVMFSDPEGATSSRDVLTLLKFDHLFGAEAGQVASDIPVAKAWVVITTGDDSKDAHSSGPYSAHTMLRAWDTTSLHSSFGQVNGLQVGDNDISPALDIQDGIIRGAEVWFDVTDYVEGVRQGATNHGIAIQGNGTADGWQIHALGSSTLEARPRLVVYSADLNGE